jgi:hypothetical protein
VHATKPIGKGEEISINYIGDYKDFGSRIKEMQFSWGFQCDCALCKADAKCSPADLTERNREWEKSFFGVAAFSPREKGSLEKLQQSKSMIDRTYDSKLYAGLPKGVLLPVLSLLLLHHANSKDYSKSCQVTVSLLHALGYEVDTQGDAILKITPTMYSVLPEGGMALDLLEPLAEQAVRAHISGNSTVAKHLLGFARFVERVGNGTDTGTAKKFKQRLNKLAGNSLSATALEREMAKLGL